jgi:hypothetical protein
VHVRKSSAGLGQPSSTPAIGYDEVRGIKRDLAFPHRQSALALCLGAPGTAHPPGRQPYRPPCWRKAKLGRVWLKCCATRVWLLPARKGTDLRTLPDYLGHRDSKHAASTPALLGIGSRGCGNRPADRGYGALVGCEHQDVGLCRRDRYGPAAVARRAALRRFGRNRLPPIHCLAKAKLHSLLPSVLLPMPRVSWNFAVTVYQNGVPGDSACIL